MMARRRYLGAALCALALWPGGTLADGWPEAGRVVSLGGAVGEIVVALGQGGRLVARDTTSTWPEAVAALPDVGYLRQLSPEGLISVAPDLILAEEGAGPPEAVEVLRAAAIPFVTIPGGHDGAAILAKVDAVASALGAGAEAETLQTQIKKELAEAGARAAAVTAPKRVLFIMSMTGGRILAAGSGTAAEGIIDMAGAVNATDGAFAGYKTLADEAVIAAAPDVILMMERGGDLGVTDAELSAHPALAATPAAENPVIRMEGSYLLGFGPRTARAALELNAALYGGEG